MIKALNLYAGIGGNRRLWNGCEVTAVEIDEDIAAIYSGFFPDDQVIVGDAHEYLRENYSKFDFIWSSPPCPTHSRIREMGVKRNLYEALYPDMKLWQEVTLLKHFSKAKWVVENVVPYYDPIVPPTFTLDRHRFWANFYVPKKKFNNRGIAHKDISSSNVVFGVDLSEVKLPKRKDQILRNMVNPEVGGHILETAMQLVNRKEPEQQCLF